MPYLLPFFGYSYLEKQEKIALTITNLIFRDNHFTDSGFLLVDGSISIENAEITNNTFDLVTPATSMFKLNSGVFVHSMVGATLEGGIIKENVMIGMVLISSSSSLSIIDSQFTDCLAKAYVSTNKGPVNFQTV